MKKILIAAFCFVAAQATAQSFQLGYTTGIMINSPANTPNLSAEQTAFAKNINMLNGLFVRYDITRRWSISLDGNAYNKNFYSANLSQYPASPYNNAGYTISTTSVDNTFYLLDLNIQYNINSKTALKNQHFKGIKSYIGFSYAKVWDRRYIHWNSFDAIKDVYTSSANKYVEKTRAIGMSYYAEYNAGKRITISLNLNARLNTEQLTPVGGKVEYNELDPDYYLSAALGVAYRITR
ncbi:MAG: hypothetical protein ACTHJ0_13685 [Flavipsychrobacter sp.]